MVKDPIKVGRVAALAAIAAVFAVLAALGIEGDGLGRLIRDYPVHTIVVLVFAILVAAFSLLVVGDRMARVAAALAAVSSAAAVVLGVLALDDRAHPTITVSASSVKRDAVTIQAGATGTYLKSGDRLLLRITAVTKRPAHEAKAQCFTPGGPIVESQDGRGVAELFWGEAAPAPSGEAKRTGTVTVDKKQYKFLCVFSALSIRAGDEDDPRYSGAFLNLRTLAMPAGGQEVEAPSKSGSQVGGDS